MFRVIAFDADDTLWHNELLYLRAQDKFKQLLSKYPFSGDLDQHFYEVDVRNVRYFGYGIKGFVLSMIEAAIEITEGQIQPPDIQEIINLGKGMTEAPVQLLDHVEETVASLSRLYELMLITKGDLLDQERKIARSGLADYFAHIEIVGEKTGRTYRDILAKHDIEPQHFLMVGNSLRSDIAPVLAIGAQAVYIPHHLTWAHETEVGQGEGEVSGYFELEHMGQLLALVRQLGDE